MSLKPKTRLGIVGGMGPLASAEFVRTIYDYSLAGTVEQGAPVVSLYSDPTVPDRTEALLNGDDTAVFRQFTEALGYLTATGATKIVICCMTIHYMLPKLPSALSSNIISLLDVIYDNLPKQGRHLVLCSSGTRNLRLFEDHHRWEQFEDFLIFPDERDQRLLHEEIIFPLKRNPDMPPLVSTLESMLERYEVDSFVAGCSEIHIIAKHLTARANGHKVYGCIDPLDILARELTEGRL